MSDLPPPTPTVVDQLAQTFAAVIREWLTVEQFREMLERNDAEDRPDVCHSHDYCDANEAMVESFQRVFPEHDVVPDTGDPLHQRLWNDAWALAVRNRFNAAPLWTGVFTPIILVDTDGAMSADWGDAYDHMVTPDGMVEHTSDDHGTAELLDDRLKAIRAALDDSPLASLVRPFFTL